MDGDDDIESLLLIAQLQLDDASEAQSRSTGKLREGSPSSDLQLALDSQVAFLHGYQRLLEDRKLAQSIDRALEQDQRMLGLFAAVDQGEQDDRQAALALSRGERLPPETQSQRSMPAVVALASQLDAEEDRAASDNDEETQVGSDAGPDWDSDETASMPGAFVPQMRRPATSRAEGSHGGRAECIICTERRRSSAMYRAPCGHLYCLGCLVDLVEACTRDETLYPLRCCQRELPEEDVLRRLTSRLRTKFSGKAVEFRVPATQRVYCINPHCSVFLGPAGEDNTYLVCLRCNASVCTGCRNEGHSGEMCRENEAVQLLETLATDNGWRRCAGCNAMVELSQGCYHMTCRCKHQFCYLCGERWKTCGCPQWDEGRLLTDANRRVVNEHGAQAAVRQPEQHAERVQEAMFQLRTNHACYAHTWAYRHGGGRCEECSFHLPQFLMRCRNCQLLVCRRCAQNRF
ncbi:unnamed protein product [Peniophora sp. CBMAI 1063]|nr:unnamed protein product [Peniophora sp. CBMAI 1063]